MNTGRSCPWRGVSGETVTFEIHTMDGDVPDAPGSYIFARESNIGWHAVYVGESSNLRDLLTPLYAYPKYECGLRRGMTHIHIHLNDQGEDDRKRQVSDITARYRPECNN